MYYYKNYYFELLVLISILFLIFYSFIRKNNKGSWDLNLYNETNKVSVNEIKSKDSKDIKDSKDSKDSNDSKGEIECRTVLEELFKKPFKKSRPNFLKNPVSGNYNLELDCYNSELQIAVEYNGIQHYKYVPYFHKNKEAFMNQKYRDDMKKRICKEYNIKLINVPYTIKIQHIKKYLYNELLSI